MNELDHEIAQMEKVMIQEELKMTWKEKLDSEAAVQTLQEKSWIEVEGEIFPFKKFLVENYTLFIPEEFELMEAEAIRRKYPYSQKANYIFSDKSTRRNFCFSRLEEAIEDDQFAIFTSGVFGGLRKLNAGMQVLNHKIDETSHSKYGFFDASLSGLDEEIYFFFGVLLIENELLFFSFTSPSSEGELWEAICIAVIQTIERKEPEKNERER